MTKSDLLNTTGRPIVASNGGVQEVDIEELDSANTRASVASAHGAPALPPRKGGKGSPANKGKRSAERIRSLTDGRGIQRDSWSISEWCAKKGLSRNAFYRMKGDRPLTITVGNKELITAAAEAEWEAMMLERARAAREADAGNSA